jgi:sRNA-binding regulator protein Hfq
MNGVHTNQDNEGNDLTPRNYSNPEPLNTSHIGKSVTVTTIDGRTVSGILRKVGQYMIEVELPHGMKLMVNKGAIITVTVN